MKAPSIWLTIFFSLVSYSVRSFAVTEEIVESLVPVQYQVTDHLIFSNSANAFSAERDSALMHEDFIHLEYGRWSGDIRFTNRFDSFNTSKHFVLEKKTVSLDAGALQIKLGDAHHEFGKGVSLSLYQDDTFGVNNTLEGLSLALSAGNVELGAIAGRVNTMENPVAVNPMLDPLGEDTLWLFGGNAKWNAAKSTKVSAHYFIGLKAPAEMKIRRFDRFWNTVGATFEKAEILPNVDFYLESNLLLPQRLVDEDFVKELTGVGSYASITWAPLPWKMKVEVKDYRDYTFPMRRGPTLEEDIVETDHSENVFGTRLYLERKDIVKKVTYLGSYLHGYDRFVNKPIHHGVFGLKFGGFHKTDWEFRTGHRRMPQHETMSHASLKVKIPTIRHQKLELNFQKLFATENLATVPTERNTNRLDLTYTFSNSFNAAVGYEYVPTNSVEQGRHFMNIGGELKSGNLTAKAFVGQTSGGTQCSAGVCRVVPPYSGAMLETVYTF